MSVQHHQPPTSLLELAWARYKTQLQKRPLLTKVAALHWPILQQTALHRP
jgi:hypothetical protein